MKKVSILIAAVLAIVSTAGIPAFAQRVSGESVRSAIEGYVRDAGSPGVETSVEFVDVRKEYGVGAVKFRLSVTSANSVSMKGLVTFLVKVVPEGNSPGRSQIIPVTARVRTFQKVFVTTRTIQPHDEIAPTDVSLVRSETTDIMNPVTDLSMLDGKWTSRWIQEGKALTFDMFDDEPVIKRGDRVTIMYRTKNIIVREQGSALQDGRKDDVIQVTNEYRDNLRGKVVGRGEVVLVN